MGPGVQLAWIQVRVRRWTPVGTPVPFPTCTLVTPSLSLDLKIHTWSSLCLLSPLHMVLSSQSPVTSISLHHSSRFPGHVKSATHVSLPCYPATNMDETVL